MKFTCKKCGRKLVCYVCQSEENIKFKHREHCYSGQLWIDLNGYTYHECNSCFTPEEDDFPFYAW